MNREHFSGFVVVSPTELVDKLHGWTWKWAPEERSTAFGLDVTGCWISTDGKSKRRMPPWPGSQGFVPTQALVAAVCSP